MIEFDYDKIMQPKTVVNCKTKEQSYNLRIWAHSKGLQLKYGVSYTDTDFASYDIDMYFCHNLYNGYHGSLNYYKNEGYTILTYNDVILKQGDKMNNKDFIKIGNKEFEITNSENSYGRCAGCHFNKYKKIDTDYCQTRRLIDDLLDIDCLSQNIIFVEKPQWVQCTYENTNVGDTIKDKHTGETMTIKHFIDIRKQPSLNPLVCVFEYGLPVTLSDFETRR